MSSSRSEELFNRARRVIPGGVNSPVRAFGAVGGTPRFMERADKAHLWDVDGNSYIDYIGSWGPHILGHGHPAIVEAVLAQAQRAMSFGAPTGLEVELAEVICAMVPSIEMVRLVNSGTEATMSAVRLARAATGRDKIIKFEGCYHGHADEFLIAAGSGAMTFGVPSSPGVTKGTAADTLTARFNDADSVQRLIDEHHDGIAAIIVEPIAGNMGVVPPADGFLQSLRRMCDSAKIILIFDEVMTGFRVALGCAQSIYDVRPDLTTLGKIIGGGLPVGAYGGRRDLMEMISPSGPVYQAGTLSGNPLAVSAGLAMLRVLREENPYPVLEQRAAALAAGWQQALNDAGVAGQINRVGSMLTMFFTPHPVVDYDTARVADTVAYKSFFHGMLDRGVMLPPSQFEALFVSAAHTEEDIESTLRAARLALR